MPSFKPKTTKKIKVNKKTSTTLDGKHREFVNEFVKDEIDKIPALKIERKELRLKLEQYADKSSHVGQISLLTIEQIMEYKDRIEEINESIKSLKNKKMEYFLDNSKYIAILK